MWERVIKCELPHNSGRQQAKEPGKLLAAMTAWHSLPQFPSLCCRQAIPAWVTGHRNTKWNRGQSTQGAYLFRLRFISQAEDKKTRDKETPPTNRAERWPDCWGPPTHETMLSRITLSDVKIFRKQALLVLTDSKELGGLGTVLALRINDSMV